MDDIQKERFKRLFHGYSEQTLADFKKYHLENPQIYNGFKKLAFEMRKSGRKTYSAKLIINVLRWQSDLKDNGYEFKISDQYQSLFPRLMSYQFPDFESFFEFRSVGTERQYTKDWFRESKDHDKESFV